MLQDVLRFSKNTSTDFTVKLLVALAFTFALGPIVVKPGADIVPITLQTLLLLFFAIAFGWRIGGLNAFLYVLLGLAGLPVFAGYVGGFEQLDSSHGGFLFGFVIAAVLIGYLAELPGAEKPWWHFLLWAGGHLIILAMGAFWLRSMNPDGWKEMLRFALPGAAMKSAFGFLFLQLVRRMLLGRGEFYKKG